MGREAGRHGAKGIYPREVGRHIKVAGAESRSATASRLGNRSLKGYARVPRGALNTGPKRSRGARGALNQTVMAPDRDERDRYDDRRRDDRRDDRRRDDRYDDRRRDDDRPTRRPPDGDRDRGRGYDDRGRGAAGSLRDRYDDRRYDRRDDRYDRYDDRRRDDRYDDRRYGGGIGGRYGDRGGRGGGGGYDGPPKPKRDMGACFDFIKGRCFRRDCKSPTTSRRRSRTAASSRPAAARGGDKCRFNHVGGPPPPPPEGGYNEDGDAIADRFDEDRAYDEEGNGEPSALDAGPLVGGVDDDL